MYAHMENIILIWLLVSIGYFSGQIINHIKLKQWNCVVGWSFSLCYSIIISYFIWRCPIIIRLIKITFNLE